VDRSIHQTPESGAEPNYSKIPLLFRALDALGACPMGLGCPKTGLGKQKCLQVRNLDHVSQRVRQENEKYISLESVGRTNSCPNA